MGVQFGVSLGRLQWKDSLRLAGSPKWSYSTKRLDAFFFLTPILFLFPSLLVGLWFTEWEGYEGATLFVMPNDGAWAPKCAVAEQREHVDVCNTFGKGHFCVLNHKLTAESSFSFARSSSNLALGGWHPFVFRLFRALFTGLVWCLVSNYCCDVAELAPGFQPPSDPREPALRVAG